MYLFYTFPQDAKMPFREIENISIYSCNCLNLPLSLRISGDSICFLKYFFKITSVVVVLQLELFLSNILVVAHVLLI